MSRDRYPNVMAGMVLGDGGRWFTESETNDGETSAKVAVYWHMPEDGSAPYLVVDVDSDGLPVKLTVNDGTVFTNFTETSDGCRSDSEGPGVVLTRGQLEAWAGTSLTDDQVESIDMAVPESSIPEAIAIIADAVVEDSDG